VCDRAQGVFLWLEITIKDIIRGARNKDSLQELRARLEITPDTIEGLYEQMLGCLMANTILRHPSRTLLDFVCAESVPWGHVLKNNLLYFESAEI
jgi:hypothetical protein